MRRTALRLALIALVSLAFAAPAQAAQPNIVVVLTDDQRWDTLRFMPKVQQELMGRGVTFRNAFVTNPVCCPSRASILSGAYSHTTGVYQNSGFMGGFPAFRDESTIATWLNDAGYSTGLFGKYLNAYAARAPYVPPGWDRWVAFRTVGYHTYALTIDGENFPYATQKYSTDFLAEQAVSFMRTAPRPFFVYLTPFAPHRYAEPAKRHEGAFPNLARWRPPSYNEPDVSDKPLWLRTEPMLGPDKRIALDTIRRNQIRSLLAVDDAVGQIVQTLSETGELANTLIVFTSDNGLLWGEHRWGARKKVPYEEAIRVPFVVRYDALGGPVRREQRLALNIDIAPTLAAAAGVAAPGAEGRSLLPLVAGDDSVRWRTRFAVEFLNAKPRSPKPPTYCALRNARYAFMTYKTGERELYDLAFDRYQLRNLAGRPGLAARIARLRAQLARLCNPPPPGLNRRLLCTHDGTAGSDSIIGSTRYDIVCARDGNDLIQPEAGPDYVYAGGGNDLVHARDGDRDVITCGSGRDTVAVDTADVARADCERVRRA